MMEKLRDKAKQLAYEESLKRLSDIVHVCIYEHEVIPMAVLAGDYTRAFAYPIQPEKYISFEEVQKFLKTYGEGEHKQKGNIVIMKDKKVKDN